MCILFLFNYIYNLYIYRQIYRGRRGPDRMVVGFTTTYAISAYLTKVVSFNPTHDDVYLIHYVIKFVSDLRQVGGFPRVL